MEEVKMTEQDNQNNNNRSSNPAQSGGFGKGGNKKSSRGRGPRKQSSDNRYDQQVIEIRRVARTVKGGKRMRFRALVAIGDHNGNIGIGLRKGVDVAESVNKAVEAAKKNMVKVSLNEGTIPHQITYKYKSSIVFLKPASAGTGVIAGGSVRRILDLAGVKNVLSKIYGSRSKLNTITAAFNALSQLETMTQVREKLK